MANRTDSHEVAQITRNSAALAARWTVAPDLTMTVGRTVMVAAPTVSGRQGLLSIQDPAGTWWPVDEGRATIDEARAWLERQLGAGDLPQTICVIGAGVGWIVDAIEERSASTGILVLEPEPELATMMLARRDWSALIQAGRLMLLTGPSFTGSGQAWRIHGSSPSAPKILIDPAVARARKELAVTAARIAGQSFKDASANEEARRRFAGPYLLNTLRNLSTILTEPSVAELVDVCPHRPVVVAGAGPSLNRNLEELRLHRDRVVYVATDTALRPSLAAGLAPDFVVGLDPGETNARHLSDLPSCPSTTLVAEPSLAPRALTAFRGRTFTFRVANHHPWPWLRAQGVDTGTLKAWGSVLVTAFDFAVRLGGDPIVLIGADLAYTNDQPYCRGTTYEEDWARWIQQGRTLDEIWTWMMGLHLSVSEQVGETTYRTAAHLVQFRDRLVEDCSASQRVVVNATGAGILHGGAIRQQPLASVVRTAPAFERGALRRSTPSTAIRDRICAALAARDLPAEWVDVVGAGNPSAARAILEAALADVRR